MPPNDSQEIEAFTQLMMANRGRLYGFIFTLVHDRDATEEILQEASVVLWRKFGQFQKGTDFGAWAMKVSRFSVAEWRRKQAKLPMQMDDALLESLAAQAMEASVDAEIRMEALEGCRKKLGERDQGLLSQRYEGKTPVAQIAEGTKRSRVAVYKVLARIHRDLMDCIENQVAGEGASDGA